MIKNVFQSQHDGSRSPYKAKRDLAVNVKLSCLQNTKSFRASFLSTTRQALPNRYYVVYRLILALALPPISGKGNAKGIVERSIEFH